jgi:hypothetical protein
MRNFVLLEKKDPKSAPTIPTPTPPSSAVSAGHGVHPSFLTEPLKSSGGDPALIADS